MKIRRTRALGLNEPLRHPDHPLPVTRRQFLGQGFITGGVAMAGASVFSLFADPRAAYANLAPDILPLTTSPCDIKPGAAMIPFICFDLAGGANIAGSNVLVGQAGGQLDFLSTAGYSKLGLPGNMVPNSSIGAGSFVDQQLGLAFHSDSAFLRGILERTAITTRANINGAVLPALSQNDTGNNPHNPMYGIYSAGALGELLGLIGSDSSDSGGNSVAPSYMMDATARPTKVDRSSDVTGLVDTGKLVGLLSKDDATAVLESMERISRKKLDNVTLRTDGAADLVVKDLVQCGYVKAAYLADKFGDAKATLDPDVDPLIVGPSGIFTQAEYDGDSEIRKTAAVMKMVVNGFAGAGTIEMGGFDYHTGDRSTGEGRDFRAGRCMGACLEYAARRHMPLMLYVFSDGSLSSNGMIDNSAAGRGKGVWTGDNQSTAAAFFLVYNPGGKVATVAAGNQIGHFSADGSVVSTSSPAANAVNLLAETVVLNYMALHGQEGAFSNLKWHSGVGTSLGSTTGLIGLGPVGPGPFKAS